MNSSIEKLEEAIQTFQRLCLTDTPGSATLWPISNAAHLISYELSGVNKILSGGWDIVSTTANTIHREIHNILGELLHDLYDYVESTKTNENIAVTAVQNVNSISEQILNDLGFTNTNS